jgi:hypothetical protein
MNFRRWNYNCALKKKDCAFYYYYLITEKIYIINNLPALLLNTTPLVSRFFAEMSKKRQHVLLLT